MDSPITDWQSFLFAAKSDFQEEYFCKYHTKLSIDDFVILRTIGQGSYGTVVLAKVVPSDRCFAIKILPKSSIVEKKQVEQTLIEKRLLQSIHFHFIVHMEHFFKDKCNIYFVMPYLVGGELYTYLKIKGKFDEGKSIFYAAQVVLAIEFLHFLDVAYRDLKPENLLLDEEGYIKITDLGFAKIIHKRTYTLCGTPDYLAPEVILSKGYSFSVDWWGLGVLIFEMCAGVAPFASYSLVQTYEFITSRCFRCPSSFSSSLKDLIDKLLELDTSRRFGCLTGGANDIKNHSWFRNVDWTDVLNRRVIAPYIPRVSGKDDTRHFREYESLILNKSDEDPFEDQFENY